MEKDVINFELYYRPDPVIRWCTEEMELAIPPNWGPENIKIFRKFFGNLKIFCEFCDYLYTLSDENQCLEEMSEMHRPHFICLKMGLPILQKK